MFEKDIYKFKPNSWAFYMLPLFFTFTIILAIKSSGFTFINIILALLMITASVLTTYVLIVEMPSIIVDYKEEKIKIVKKNKLIKMIPFKPVAYFEVSEGKPKGNEIIIRIWRAMYSDGSEVLQLNAVYNNGKKELVTIRPESALVNVLKKKFEIKYATKWIKLRYGSYQRVYLICILMVIIFLIMAIMK